MRKKIFLSYSVLRSADAEVVETFLGSNGFEIIRDTYVKDSFMMFMNQIRQCDCVVMLLNNTFFESPLCTYELVISYLQNKKIYPIWCCDLELNREEVRKKYYEQVISNEVYLAPEQKKFLREQISSFEKYEVFILKLINEIRYPRKTDLLEDACNEIYETISNN